MPKLPRALPIPPLNLRQGLAPLHRQLYKGLRETILEGCFRAGAQLPSTRTLAHALGISRTTVVTAYEQLLAEGYLAGKVGSGTFVAHILPDDLLTARPATALAALQTTALRPLSRRGMLLATTPFSGMTAEGASRALRPGVPALDQFPVQIWGRLEARLRRNLSRRLLGYHDPAGYQPLREAIASYLRVARGMRCEAGQVIIVNGSAQALDLAARMLLDPGDAVWIEDPGYVGARGVFTSAGAKLIPIPVDPEGFDVARAIAMDPDARLAYVTPSHQYPVGVTMSLARRLALIEWATRSQAWVVEDDYENEYRYVGRPLAALQGLDRANRVLYVGTFSKVLFPALRLGYLVVPPALADAFVSARALADRGSPVFEQAVLAEFLHEGHFARHIRRMRQLYGERQAVLIDAAGRELAGRVDVRPAEAGMHLVGWLQDGVDDREVSARAGAHGVEAPALSRCRITPDGPGGLLLGYTAFTGEEIRAGVRRLAITFGS